MPTRRTLTRRVSGEAADPDLPEPAIRAWINGVGPAGCFSGERVREVASETWPELKEAAGHGLARVLFDDAKNLLREEVEEMLYWDMEESLRRYHATRQPRTQKRPITQKGKSGKVYYERTVREVSDETFRVRWEDNSVTNILKAMVRRKK